MKNDTSCVLALIVTMVLGTAARAAETIKPLSLSDSIDLALKQSVLIHSAQEGVRGAEAQMKEAFTGFLPEIQHEPTATPVSMRTRPSYFLQAS